MPNSRRFKHSVTYWTLGLTEWNWDFDRICQTARALGIESIELVPFEFLPKLAAYGLTSALAINGMPDPPFARGVNNPRYHEEIVVNTKKAIDECVRFQMPNVIAFVGYKWNDAFDPGSGEISRDHAIESSIKVLREISQYAGSRGVNVCLEHLNTRDSSHPMKGHPGYQGDDLDLCAEIIRRAGMPSLRLLFDVYHVQIMHGDVIRRMRENADLIGHVHTAGNPGRGELDDRQEIHYPGVARALSAIGYQGFVGHEFIPTVDPVQGLSQAITLCEPPFAP
jgi:sugar phosphate isomerase/epimerase